MHVKKKTVNECCNNTNVTQNVEKENNDLFSEFIIINNNYEEISESETNTFTNEKTFST